MPEITRRNLLSLGASTAGCTVTGSAVPQMADAVAAAEAARRGVGRNVVTARLTPAPVTVSLGDRVVQTWASHVHWADMGCLHFPATCPESRPGGTVCATIMTRVHRCDD